MEAISSIGEFFGTASTKRHKEESQRLLTMYEDLADKEECFYKQYKVSDDKLQAVIACKSLEDYVATLNYKLGKREEELKRKQNREDRLRNLKNEAAKSTETKRQIAEAIKKKLKRNEVCPYCGTGIDYSNGEVHADHIYPISKGGHSTIRNMVYVCGDCNRKKSNLTLTQFIKKYNMDREQIELRLDKLGKDY